MPSKSSELLRVVGALCFHSGEAALAPQTQQDCLLSARARLSEYLGLPDSLHWSSVPGAALPHAAALLSPEAQPRPRRALQHTPRPRLPAPTQRELSRLQVYQALIDSALDAPSHNVATLGGAMPRLATAVPDETCRRELNLKLVRPVKII